VAERSSLVRLQREWDVRVEWNGYELHPETPPGGLPLGAYLPNAEGVLRHVAEFASRFGISDLRAPARVAKTRRVLALAEHARDRSRLEEFRAAAFDAYWRHGWCLEADGDLRAVARAAGLDPDAALAAAEAPEILARVEAARRRALEAGVTGIPTFDLGGARVVGCQPYDVLAAAARRAGAERRSSASRSIPPAAP
jgi:predicted DsbA family dithiol-disulfide isomerase